MSAKSSEPVTRLLRLAACIEPDPSLTAMIRDAAADVQWWPVVVDRAESHGLAPLLWQHLHACGVDVPEGEQRKFRALALRHRLANQVRAGVLVDIVKLYEQHGIDCIALKGGAIAHLIYPRPGLRPMRDLDLLVHPAQAQEAQRLLAELGFDAPLRHSSRMMRYHHHLPIASGVRDGLTVSIEIHRDALSGDYPQSIGFDTLLEPPQRFSLAGQAISALNHADMLHHLYRHAFEPAQEMRLIYVADIIGYASHFASVIDWEMVTRRLPAVVNALALLHYINPLPAALERFRPGDDWVAPGGIGRGFVPLSQLLSSGRTRRQILREALYPSEWWLHAYYGAAPTTSCSRLRWTKHAARLVRWGLRRGRAATGEA